MGKGLNPPRTKPKLGKRLWLINFILFIIPVTYLSYQPLLRLSASIVITDDEPGKSDAILVLAGGEPGRPWGAAELYNAKLARYVIVTKDRPTINSGELLKLGIEVVDGYGNYLRVLHGLGVPDENIVTIDTPVDDTFDELRHVSELCSQRNWHSLIIVTSNYHTRRARLTARYIFGPQFKLAVVGSKHGGLDRNAWWKNNADVRTFLIEFEKLVAYTLYIGPRIWTSRNDTKPENRLSVSRDSLLTP
jgi:uncharacterized SAM-binding protein YcdF (DUF218 family)